MKRFAPLLLILASLLSPGALADPTRLSDQRQPMADP